MLDSYHIKQFNKLLMAEGYGYFGREVKTSGKLHEMLNQPNITPEKLFSVANISGDINQNIQTFLSFCNKRKQFTTKMLNTCFNSAYQQLQNDEVKKIAQYTIQVLTNDEVALSDFLFYKQEQLKSSSQIDQKVEQETGSTHAIQNQAQRLFSQIQDNKKQQKSIWQNEVNIFEKYQLIKITLQHLKQNKDKNKNKNKNQTCLGYINKLYSSLLRREGNLFLLFLQDNIQYLDVFINNLEYYAVGGIVALMLSCEDKSGQYKYEQLKKLIFARIIQYGLQNLDNSHKFQGFISTCQQILSSTKQSYYEYFQDFKRCANILVSQPTLLSFYNSLLKSQQHYSNASIYLQLILKRINNENEEHDYYKNHNTDNQNNQSTMIFQHQFLYSKIGQLVELLDHAQTKKYRSIKRIGLLGFFVGVVKNMEKKGRDGEIGWVDVFKRLIVVYVKEDVGGLVKNYMFQLLKLIIKRLKENDAKDIAEWLTNSNIEFSSLQKLFQSESGQNQTSVQASNSNTTSCFILSLMFDIQNKENQFLENYSKKNHINLNYPYERYKTKIANTQDEDMMSPTYEEIQSSFNLASKFKMNVFVKDQEDAGKDKEKEKNQGQKQLETQVVGKNSVVIPVLHLPNKIDNTKIIVQEEPVEQVKITAQMSRQALIRDLKNTRIELPDRLLLKGKKSQEQQKKAEVEVVGKQVQQQQLQSLDDNKINLLKKEDNKSKQGNNIAVQIITPSNTNSSDEPSTLEQKYFIRHILLF